MGRRRFLGYLVGGATVIAAADLGILALAEPARAKVKSAPQVADLYDFSDLLRDSAKPTSQLIEVMVDGDGHAHFALPRCEVGQGITTAIAMIIAEELELPLERVHVTLAPARPELVWNQLTGGSNTIHTMYTPVRVACAIAKGALLDAAAILLGGSVADMTIKEGVVIAPSGETAPYGELSKLAATPTTTPVEVVLKDENSFSVVGKPTNRVDALAAVTGTKPFATDLDIPDALPTMICRAPTLNGTPVMLRNSSAIKAMPGVTHVAKIATGIAVRARTFGQCIDAVRAMDVQWNDGPVAGESDQDIVSEVKAAELPLAPLPNNPLSKTISADFTFYFRSNSPMDTGAAVADVRSDRAEIWSSLKMPIVAGQQIAEELGLPADKVKVHVVTGGGRSADGCSSTRRERQPWPRRRWESRSS